MPDSDRDPVPTTPPPALRSVQFPEPVSGLREERIAPDGGVNDTELSHDTDLSLAAAAGANPDTLMSLPKPLPHDELPYETRLRQLEDRVETLETRLDQAQRGALSGRAERSTPWWFWLLFMVGLAVTWRLLGLLR
jgi:hypothetical protein